MKQKFKIIALGLLIGISIASCSSVKAYQKAKLNNKEMFLTPKLAAQFELQFHTYREGSSGANGGKTGGGCGCN